jgi:polyhydroxybutyrate depolymerase
MFCTKNENMKKVTLILLIILVSVAAASAQSKSILIGQQKRKYVLYLPKDYRSTKTYPLVYNFHGGGMTATEQMFYSRMNQTADKHGFIIVYPSGINADWNVGFEMSYKNGTNDIGFIQALTDTLKKNYSVNSQAIFATGLSRGGFFCHRLATELPEVFAAVASIGGPLPDSVKLHHRSAKNVSIMQVSGTEDKIVDYQGKSGAYSSAVSTFNYWVAHNKLSASSQRNKSLNANKKDGTSVSIKEVTDGSMSVMLVSIDNGGHTWPGSDSFNIGYPLGKTTKDLDINEAMWAFFQKSFKH